MMKPYCSIGRNWRRTFAPAALAVITLTASAATRVWDGGSAASGNWTDAVNWNPNTAPVAGDQLVFPAGAARLVNTNNFAAGGGFDRIHFTGTGYQIYGNSVRVTNGVFAGNASGNVVFRPSLLVTAGNPSYIVTNAAGTLTLAGIMDISGRRVTIDGAGTLIIDGPIGGSAVGTRISKGGSGLLTFNGTNTYTGDHTNNSGTIWCAGPMAAALGG